MASDVFSAFVDPGRLADGGHHLRRRRGAVLLRAGDTDEPGALGPVDLGTDGAQADLLEVPGDGARARKRTLAAPGAEFSPYFRMDGPAVRKQAIVGMCDSVTRAVQQAGWSLGELDAVVAHQANQRSWTASPPNWGWTPGGCCRTSRRTGTPPRPPCPSCWPRRPPPERCGRGCGWR
ncbi:hypothetical protein ACFSNO_17720 [Streptomyces cirratus]